MDVSIIIINYNTLDMTRACIDSIFEKTSSLDFEVILVDNNSKDNSKDFFEKDKRIIYVYNNDNLGFGVANNVGLKFAKGRNILFLNSDTLLVNNAIKILSDYLDGNSDVGACGGNLYNKDMTPNMSFLKHYPSFIWEINALFHGYPSRLIGYKDVRFNYSEQPCTVAYIWGADLMIRKSVLNETGAFDEDFFMYFEETELCHRITCAGYRIMSVPQAQIIHLNGGSTKTHKGPSEAYIQSNYKYINKSNRNFLIRTLHKWVLTTRIFYHRLFGLWDK